MKLWKSIRIKLFSDWSRLGFWLFGVQDALLEDKDGKTSK